MVEQRFKLIEVKHSVGLQVSATVLYNESPLTLGGIEHQDECVNG